MAIRLREGDPVKVSQKKLTLLSVSKDDHRELYVFDKQQEFLPFLLDFLLKIGFDKEDTHIVYFFGIPHNQDEEKDQLITEEHLADPWKAGYLPMSFFNESFEHINNDTFDIEVIFFSSEIYLIVRKKKRSKINFGKIIGDNSVFRRER